MTRRCINCGEQVHISNFDTVFENGIPITSRLCCWYCKSEYNKQIYMKRVINEHWQQEKIFQINIFISSCNIHGNFT
jgi:hypothetical protein